MALCHVPGKSFTSINEIGEASDIYNTDIKKREFFVSGKDIRDGRNYTQ
jgi:hypothetical protein